MNCAETIREITRKHIMENKGVVLCQALTAAGWVGNTVPELPNHPNLIELSIEDTSNSGIAVGYALAGRRPIYICRYQGFMWINASSFTNYAAKAKEMWGYSVPVFIRAISMEGGIGPVASNSHHGMITRMPGIKVYAPMTPDEYRAGWNYFMEQDGPFYCSEHRRSFKVDYEIPDIIHPKADVTLFPISAARLEALEAIKQLERIGIICNVSHLVWLKPFTGFEKALELLERSAFGGIIIDTDYENGVSKCIAYDLMMQSSKKVRVLGLEERTAGFAPRLDNLPPSAEKISSIVEQIVNRH